MPIHKCVDLYLHRFTVDICSPNCIVFSDGFRLGPGTYCWTIEYRSMLFIRRHVSRLAMETILTAIGAYIQPRPCQTLRGMSQAQHHDSQKTPKDRSMYIVFAGLPSKSREQQATYTQTWSQGQYSCLGSDKPPVAARFIRPSPVDTQCQADTTHYHDILSSGSHIKRLALSNLLSVIHSLPAFHEHL